MTGYRMPSYVEEILTENYCKNFVRMLSSYDNDIFVNIIGSNVKDASGSVILTDIPPSDLQ